MSLSVQSSTASQIALENLVNRLETPATGAGKQAAKTGDSLPPSSIWSISDPSALASADSSGDELDAASSAADAAVSAGGVVIDLLTRMRQAAVGASDPSLGASDRTALNASYQADLARIGATLGQASAGGLNLIDGSLTSDVQVGAGDATATLSPADLTPGGPLIGLSANTNLLDAGSASDAAGVLNQALGAVTQAVGRLAGQAQSIQGHLDLLSQASWLGSSGASSAGPAVVDQDGARLQALMVQQQLSSGAYSVANQAPQAILSLFR